MSIYEDSLKLHETFKGKLRTEPKMDVANLRDLSLVYSPGVAEPSRRIAADRKKSFLYTGRGNRVAVISDGTAVLGLGDIGPEAAMPVMEGKALLFRTLGGVDADPICLDVADPEEFIRTVKALAPSFGAVNLEDIASPECFYIEKRLKEELDIPVFHDDQHGTAVCVLAGLINAHKILGRDLSRSGIVINGAGAAGTAIARLLLAYGAENIVMVDREGIINRDENHTMLHGGHKEIAGLTNSRRLSGGLDDALEGADVFIGVSRAGLLKPELVKRMSTDPVIFAMANPEPEIDPEEAEKAGAGIVATGRADYPNMVNNILAFPGIIKGALRSGAPRITEEMKLVASLAIANSVPVAELRRDCIFPDPLDRKVACSVARAVMKQAKPDKGGK